MVCGMAIVKVRLRDRDLWALLDSPFLLRSGDDPVAVDARGRAEVAIFYS
jgi:hypothetical protein